MFDDWEWVLFALIALVVAVVISLIVIFLYHHPFIAGLLVGLIIGIGGNITYSRVRQWFRSHRIVEIEPPEK
jgi:uncharacterized membrane protein